MMGTDIARRGLFRLAMAASTVAVVPGVMKASERTTPQHDGMGAMLDYQDVQVLFSDLQTSLVAGSRTTTPANIGRAAAALAKVAEVLKLPTVFSVVPERRGEPELIPELKPFATPTNTLKRSLAGSLMDKVTVDAIASNGRKTLIVAGYAAEVVVLQTVLDALNSGYNVQFVVDAIGGLSERTEAAALRQMELAGAIPTSVVSITSRMTPDFFHSPGSETFAAIMPLL